MNETIDYQQLLSEKDAEIQRLKEELAEKNQINEDRAKALVEQEAEIQHLKEQRVKDIQDAWDACEEYHKWELMGREEWHEPLDKASYLTLHR
jgi:hypothetical protein